MAIQGMKKNAPALLVAATPSSRPADGYVDTIRLGIENALKRYDELPTDVYLSMMKTHATDAANALESVRRFLWRVKDDSFVKFHATTTLQQVALQHIAANDRPNFFAHLRGEVRDNIINETGDEASDLARACVEKMQAFYDAHKAALDDFAGPRLMSVEGRALTIQDLERQQMLKKEVALMQPTKILALYMRYLERGEDQKLVELECAAQEAAIAGRTENPAVMKDRLHATVGHTVDVDKEKTACWDILSAIRGRKLRAIPASLKASEVVLFELRGVFQLLVGVHATLMQPNERAARFYSNSDDKNLTGELNQFEVDRNWLRRRFEQQAPYKLPGWSEPRMKDLDGNWVREPLRR